eukprot:TRINITY_DN13798_c0_g1_i1.p1 TRINITY_DN13798_c0_g1~~TRINITY_DN13798_c0_g1_i1.p1  ORF type:complete len:554 (-),score=49.59 TRINITY_DN13798_c0_g1_i1:115-1776(-)
MTRHKLSSLLTIAAAFLCLNYLIQAVHFCECTTTAQLDQDLSKLSKVQSYDCSECSRCCASAGAGFHPYADLLYEVRNGDVHQHSQQLSDERLLDWQNKQHKAEGGDQQRRSIFTIQQKKEMLQKPSCLSCPTSHSHSSNTISNPLLSPTSPQASSLDLPSRIDDSTGNVQSAHPRRSMLTSPLSPPPEFPGCGYWQRDYIALHAAILAGQSAPRFAVSVAVEKGLADRLLGVITQFYYALLTRRAFQITPGSQAPFEVAWDSPYINWTRQIPRGFEKNASNGVRWLYLDDYGKKPFSDRDLSKVPRGAEKEQTVFLQFNRGRTYTLFENPVHGPQLRAWGLRPETAFSCAFHFLFRPVPEVLDLAREARKSLDADPFAVKIGIQVRHGDTSFTAKGDQAVTLAAANKHLSCARQVEESRKYEGQRVVWLFISDSATLRKVVKEAFQEKVVVIESAQIGHLGKCRHKIDCVYDASKKEAFLRSAAADLLLFSKTDYQVVSERSGFGRVGAWLSSSFHCHPLELYEVNPSSQAMSCQPGESTPLQVSAMTYSGI